MVANVTIVATVKNCKMILPFKLKFNKRKVHQLIHRRRRDVAVATIACVAAVKMYKMIWVSLFNEKDPNFNLNL